MGKKVTDKTLLLFACIAALILLPTLIYPHGRDQGMFAYTGRIVLRGAVPFRDFWDTKPPAIYYVYALSELLFGRSMAAVRVLDLFWQLATAIVIFGIARYLSGRRATAFIAGLLYILSYALRGWWNTAQPDDFLNLPVALAMLLLLTALARARSPGLLFAAGLLLGATFYFRYPMGAMLIVFTFAVLSVRGSGHERGVSLCSLWGGFAAVVGGYALYLYSTGAWSEFAYAEFTWARAYTRVGGGGGGALSWLHCGDILNSHFTFVALAAVAAAGYAGAWKRGACDSRSHLIALWALAALFTLYVQRKFYLYHYAPLVPPLSIGAAFLIAYAGDVRTPAPHRLGAWLLVVSAVVLSLRGVNERYNLYCIRTYRDSARSLVGKARGVRPDDYYMNVRFTSDDFSLPADLMVAGYLSRNTRPDDRVFIWGCETLVYYLAGRNNVSRFIHNFPFRCDWTPPRFAAELLAELEREKPSYVLLVTNDPTWWATGTREDSLASLRRYPRLEQFVAQHYVFDRAIEDFLIYRRREG